MTVKNYQSSFLRYFMVFGLFITLMSSVISHNIHIFYLNNALKNHAQFPFVDHNCTLQQMVSDEKANAMLLEVLKESDLIITFLGAFLSLFLSIPLALYAARTPNKLQKKLNDSNVELKRFSKIIDRYVITATTTPEGIITGVSSAFSVMSGYAKEELIGHKMSINRHPDTPKEVHKQLWKTILRGDQWVGEVKNKAKNGEPYWLEQIIIPVKNEEDTIIMFFMSVGIDNNAKKELERLALVDKLTNLYNRHKMDESLIMGMEKAHDHHQPLSVIMIDIDHFKAINDTYGHPVGDSVLQKVAQIMTDSTRQSDYCGRYGGEEFLIMCPDTDEKGAITLAEHIRKMVEAYPFDVVNHLTISIGVTTLNTNDTMMTLIQHSDEALYKAKNQGRNRVVAYS
jgi:diguanylate cyclase (GGDEF)-like protein/PAS domain S-box-containing protein